MPSQIPRARTELATRLRGELAKVALLLRKSKTPGLSPGAQANLLYNAIFLLGQLWRYITPRAANEFHVEADSLRANLGTRLRALVESR